MEATTMSERDHAHLTELSREECLGLVQQEPVGRIGYVVDGLAMILPVNFVVLDGGIVFCTAKGGTLAWLSNRQRVTFEVDHSSVADQQGWSVLVRGSANEVTDPDQLAALRQSPLHSWVRSPDDHWVRITIDAISGRSVHGGGH
jgi:hypothetical protein